MLLPNGHALMISYHLEPRDLSHLGGHPRAMVAASIIQEQDSDVAVELYRGDALVAVLDTMPAFSALNWEIDPKLPYRQRLFDPPNRPHQWPDGHPGGHLRGYRYSGDGGSLQRKSAGQLLTRTQLPQPIQLVYDNRLPAADTGAGSPRNPQPARTTRASPGRASASSWSPRGYLGWQGRCGPGRGQRSLSVQAQHRTL